MPDFDTKSTSKKRARKGGGGGAGADKTAPADANLEAVDLQQNAGNAAVTDMIEQEKQEEEEAKPEVEEHKLPSTYRARLLSDSGAMALATTIYAEAAPSREKTDEMLAIASVAMNQLDHVKQNAEDQVLFGGTSLEDILSNKSMFLNHGLSRHATFHSAARFGTAFGSKEDLDAAKAAIDAAAQVMLSGNPFMHDYKAFSLDRKSPLPDQTDAATKTKIGKYFFWAFKEDVATPEAAEEEEAPAPEILQAVMPGTPEAPV